MTYMDIAVLHGACGTSPDEVDTLATAGALCDLLMSAGHNARLMHLAPDLRALRTLAAQRPDLIVNLVDAVGGDGSIAAAIPAELDRMGLDYTGCGARASAACAAKPGMKKQMRRAGLPTPDWSLTGASFRRGASVIVKAISEHASIGLDAASIVPEHAAAAEILSRTARFGIPFFAEEYIEGREFNVSLLGGPAGPEVLPPAEIDFVGFPPDRPRIVDYEAKWLEDGFAFHHTPRRFDFPAEDAPLLAELTALALRAWSLFGLSGYARVDFRVVGHGRPLILEVNTNPCLAGDAGFAAAALCAGIDYPTLIARIVDAAVAGRKAA